MSTLSMNSNIIGISYGQMNNIKINLKRAEQMLQKSQSYVNSAIGKIQVDGSSSRLRLSNEQLSSIYSDENKRNARIDKICNNIDYIIRRFQDVDSRCAKSIKTIGKDYNLEKSVFDKFKSGVTAIGNDFKTLIDEGRDAFNNFCDDIGNGISAIGQWMEDHHVMDYLVDGANILIGALAFAALLAALPFSGLAAAEVIGLIVAGGHGLNSVINGGADIYNKSTGKKEDTFNWLRYKYQQLGEGLGYGSGWVIDSATGALTGKDYNYRSTLSKLGNEAGWLGYYVVDTKSAPKDISESLKIIKEAKKDVFTEFRIGEGVGITVGKTVTTGPTNIMKSGQVIKGSANVIAAKSNVEEAKDYEYKSTR